MKVHFDPIARVKEFDKTSDKTSGARTYTVPILTDMPWEFDGVQSARVNAYARSMVKVVSESGCTPFRDDLCRLFLVSFFVDNETHALVSETLQQHGVRSPIFSDFKHIRANHIRDPEAIERYRTHVRERYRVRLAGGGRTSAR